MYTNGEWHKASKDRAKKEKIGRNGKRKSKQCPASHSVDSISSEHKRIEKRKEKERKRKTNWR